MSNSDLEGQMKDRLARAEKLTADGINPFANDYKPSHSVQQVANACEDNELPAQDVIAADAFSYSVAGRLIQVNNFGKIKFFFIRGDKNFIIQGLLRKNDSTELFELSKSIQEGDIIGFSGKLFKTQQGKRALLIDNLRLLTKAIRPLPNKVLGDQDVKDVELLYRQRYLDFIQHSDKIEVFRNRNKIIQSIRYLLSIENFVEVETRSLVHTNGGANARPFKTHHNALDKDFYLRIAPELDLKRCMVGGMDRVFSIEKQWRNEGMDKTHNPEFTSLEFYQAYATYLDGMKTTEHLLRVACFSARQQDFFMFNDQKIDLTFFARKTMLEAVLEVMPDLAEDSKYGKKLVDAFERYVEHTLIQPTFITQHPIETSPLARKNDSDPRFVDRFELFMCGQEIANGFSELNDPRDQRARFEEQVKAKSAGDDEAQDYDEDFCVALEHGMPPAAGVGVGIDRCCVFFLEQQSIRDVILFPAYK